MSRILMVASEATPFAKSGGLADVLGALPQALREQGEDVAVVMPRYARIGLDHARRVWDDLVVWLGPNRVRTAVYEIVQRGVPYYFLDCPGLFDRPGLYGEHNQDYGDNAFRFAALCRGAIEVGRQLFRPQIFHCHDWQAGLVGAYLHRVLNTDPTFYRVRNLLTIHNLGYQGNFWYGDILGPIGLPGDLYRPDLLEFRGAVSFLKAGLVFADRISTVSPTYAREIQTPEHGFGMDGLLRARSQMVSGILNGVDYDEWNPETDPFLAAHYSARDLGGKRACKADLLAQYGLPADNLDRPVIGIVSRFATQKGFDLIAQTAHEILNRDVQMVVLGNGERSYEDFFRYLAAVRPGQVGVRIAYDNALAHKIEAGSDMFLMPSRYEPCGLNQIYSLRYGTVPIVHATGGLDDTIEDGTGFKFRHHNAEGLLWAIRSAFAAWDRQDYWKSLILNGMTKDFSWRASAAQYRALYRSMLGG